MDVTGGLLRDVVAVPPGELGGPLFRFVLGISGLAVVDLVEHPARMPDVVGGVLGGGYGDDVLSSLTRLSLGLLADVGPARVAGGVDGVGLGGVGLGLGTGLTGAGIGLGLGTVGIGLDAGLIDGVGLGGVGLGGAGLIDGASFIKRDDESLDAVKRDHDSIDAVKRDGGFIDGVGLIDGFGGLGYGGGIDYGGGFGGFY